MSNTLQLPAVTRSREVERLVNGIPTTDGAGVRLTRVLTHDLQRRLDPFLMLDAFRSDNPDDYIAGFPSHPHRGFETVTYMLNGRMRHRDNAGNEGLLTEGGVQWMTAGRGIVHSEIPEQQDGLMEGFQLWVNLPGKNKMTAPWYRDIPAADIPVHALANGASLKLISGLVAGASGAITRDDTEPFYADLVIPAGQSVSLPLQASHNAFVYVYRGEASIGGRTVKSAQMGLLNNAADADGVTITAGESETRLIALSGKPLAEPIVQWGPFVMNSREQVEQAILDYQAGRF
ncbi:pirin family protein [Silvimonas amylolytica]|uniref:Quercetin 2,3-dioxygenase n=1 Tax=Silvimonas amylolytica TaxID=449663 RepID=A0ABQ2PN83_9NEIS|nr:pirin family protein [Silvimonas amylolytica]GGP26661.1 putative quercetin 2,3-dioxygenase [Silvimonas amylolytica]